MSNPNTKTCGFDDWWEEHRNDDIPTYKGRLRAVWDYSRAQVIADVVLVWKCSEDCMETKRGSFRLIVTSQNAPWSMSIFCNAFEIFGPEPLATFNGEVAQAMAGDKFNTFLRGEDI